MSRNFSFSRTSLIAIAALTSFLFLSACKTAGPQNPAVSEGPDHAEMGKRAEISSELERVFAPIDAKAEQLEK